MEQMIATTIIAPEIKDSELITRVRQLPDKAMVVRALKDIATGELHDFNADGHKQVTVASGQTGIANFPFNIGNVSTFEEAQEIGWRVIQAQQQMQQEQQVQAQLAMHRKAAIENAVRGVGGIEIARR